MTIRNKKNRPIDGNNKRVRPVKVTDEEIAEALQNTGGVLEEASKWLLKNKGINVARTTLSTRLSDTPALRDVKELAENRLLDTAENGLFEYVKHKNLRAIMYLLDRKGKNRGYVSRYSAEIANKEGESFRVSTEDPEMEKKPIEEVMRLAREHHDATAE